MWRYLKAAFLLRVPVPVLGAVPVNALAVACVAILGFAHPAIWLLGLGLETAFLAALATNRRFQKIVEAGDVRVETMSLEAKQQMLAAELIPPVRQRLTRLEERCAKALGLYRNLDADDVLLDANAEALKQLRWLYLKLLLAEQYLRSPELASDEAALRRQIGTLERELSETGRKLPEPLRASKSATLDILRRRLENLERREQSLREIESDLNRIEAQVDLVVEQAAMQRRPAAVSSNIELATQMLDLGLYGASSGTVQELDQTFAAPARVPA